MASKKRKAKSRKKKSVTICKKCGHDMGRSRCKPGADGKWEVRCNACKTVYVLSIRFPPREKDT